MNTRVILCAGAVAMLATLAVPEEEVIVQGWVNPWDSRKVGDWVRVEELTETPRGKSREVYTVTLIAKGDKTVRLRTEETRDGKPLTKESDRKRSQTTEAKIEWKDVRTETLEVDGMQLECRVQESTDLGPRQTNRRWRAKVDGKDVTVREEEEYANKDGGEMRTVTVLKKLRETLEVGDLKVDCRVTELTLIDETGETPFVKVETTWSTDRIPFGYAKRVTRLAVSLDDPGNVTTTVVQAFGSAKSD